MRKLYILCAILMLAQSAFAQVKETSSWRFGFTGGVHASELRISDLNKDLYPSHKALFSGMGSVYFQKSFGSEFNFALRPEIAYLSRGGSLEDIMRNRVGYYQDKGLNNLTYKVNAHYLDVRLPIMYRFGTTTSTIRPYVYVAPILGIATGGNISSEHIYASAKPSELYKLDATKANLNPVYFSGAVGVGFDWLFNAGGHTVSLGFEAMYEHGFTDTYGDDAKIKLSTPIADIPEYTQGTGPRRFSGLELKVTLGIPFSVFGKAPANEKVVFEDDDEDEEVEEETPEREYPDKKCYSLNEILNMMADGQSVYGKTICDIDEPVEFDFNKSTIRPESYDYLQRLADAIIRTNASVKVVGHTDNVGSDEVNMKLSRERAISVMNYLKECGVSPSKLSYEYFGKDRPIDTNETVEGRRHNRRVEFELNK